MDTDRPNRALAFLAGIGIGAAIMYFLDPEGGARRRRMVSDQTLSTVRFGTREAREAAMNARNHAKGMMAETRARLTEERPDDEQLVARVRSEMGHHIERARNVEVFAEDGVVTLRGKTTEEDLPSLLAAVEHVRGVRRVENQLETHGGTST